MQRWLENFEKKSSFLVFCCIFGLIFGKCQILNFGDFSWCPGRFFDYFRAPGAPATSRMWLNIDFKAYQKIEVLVIFFALPDNFDLRFTPAFRKDLEPILRMRFSF